MIDKEDIPETAVLDWAAANSQFLAGELHGLRLRLQRRVRWLRQQWQPDALHGYADVVTDAQADWLLRGENRAAEAEFYASDGETAVITQALHHNQDRQFHLSQTLAHTGTPPALHLLARQFNLTEFEEKVILLCFAPEEDPAFADLFAYLQDQASRKYATLHLALTLFGNDARARNSFLPSAPLRRYALVELVNDPLPATALAHQPLRLPARVADYLRGVNRLSTAVSPYLTPLPPLPIAPSHEQLADQLSRWLANHASEPPVVNLVGSQDVGRQAVAQAVCHRTGLQLVKLRLPDPAEALLLRPLFAREAVLSQMAYYLEMTPGTPADTPWATAVPSWLEQLEAVLLVGSTERMVWERPSITVSVHRPPSSEQYQLWQQALAPQLLSSHHNLAALVQQFNFGPGAIVVAANAAKIQAQLRASDNGAFITPSDLWQACRQQSGPRLGQLARRIDPVYAWDDIVLPANLMQQLQELAAQGAQRHRVYETWGFGAQMNRGRGISALFAGPSGTGKTMAAEILANALALDLYRIDLSGVVSKYIGETEKNLKQVFDAAEQSGAILFFDEADALFGKRTEVKDSHDRYANIEVNYLLQRMEEYGGLAILATNRKSALDKAFLRRLRFLLDFPFPDANGRFHIWQKVFPAQAPLNEVDFATLARLEIPGGNIRNIALNAAFLAAAQDSPIEMTHIMAAARREYAKIDKMATPYEFGEYFEKS